MLEVAIRGFVDPNGVNVTNENPVPIYIDDVFYGRQTAMALQLNEIERIEVLRGPQGTLFGKNAEGGAVRFVTQEPTGTFGIQAKRRGRIHGYYNTTTHLDLPSVAGVATKIDFVDSADSGWQTNSAPGQENFGQTKYIGARFTALWKPSDQIRAGILVRLDAGEIDGGLQSAAFHQRSVSVHGTELHANDLADPVGAHHERCVSHLPSG